MGGKRSNLKNLPWNNEKITSQSLTNFFKSLKLKFKGKTSIFNFELPVKIPIKGINNKMSLYFSTCKYQANKDENNEEIS